MLVCPHRRAGGSNPAAPAIAICLSFLATPADAQLQDEQLWLQVNTNVPVTDRVRVTLEQIARFGDRAGGLFQTEFGGLVGYKVANGVELGGGYRKVGAHNGGAPDEDRLRQQVVLTSGPLTARLRVDERFLATGGEVGFRVRPQLRYTHRLRGSPLSLFVSHESFFLPNSTRWGQRAGYERMRNLAGVTVPLGKRVSGDVGYLNQYRFGRGGARAQMDHALNLQLTINLAARPHPHTDD